MIKLIGQGYQGKIYYDPKDDDVCYKVYKPGKITLKSLLKSAELQNRVAELGYAPFAHECLFIGDNEGVMYQDYLQGYEELDYDHPDLHYIIYTVINALKEANVAHNDLFTGNIMVNKNLDIKIIDFANASDGAFPEDDHLSLLVDLGIVEP